MIVQRNDNQEIYEISNIVTIPFSFALTSEAAQALYEISLHTKDENIELFLSDGNITIKTSETVKTISQTKLADFYKNQPTRHIEIASALIDINDFKTYVDDLLADYQLIKKANQSHLLIKADSLNVVSLIEDYDFGEPIELENISVTETHLYLMNLQDIGHINFKDNIDKKDKNSKTPNKYKIAILKEDNQENIYKLGFYKYLSSKYPFATTIIEPAHGDIDKVEKSLADAQECEKLASSKPVQTDLFKDD